ncbi:Uncharacterized protein DAT39_005157 [Clarias magur]|uniref:Uncharacterized protein n=1 Tax=Clarias magur TaxID=1594786 RepID=A0A8J4UEJ6_CLAMG|nr:Uncharacterized protein DAT39_005157 [Clarias magur]
MRKSPLIYTQQLRRREALLIGVAAAALANFTCHGNLGVKIVSQKSEVRAGRENGKDERIPQTCWLHAQSKSPWIFSSTPLLI